MGVKYLSHIDIIALRTKTRGTCRQWSCFSTRILSFNACKRESRVCDFGASLIVAPVWLRPLTGWPGFSPWNGEKFDHDEFESGSRILSTHVGPAARRGRGRYKNVLGILYCFGDVCCLRRFGLKLQHSQVWQRKQRGTDNIDGSSKSFVNLAHLGANTFWPCITNQS
jgi:hypothetical protein